MKNEECRMKITFFGLRVPQSRKTNSHSSFFILHSSLRTFFIK